MGAYIFTHFKAICYQPTEVERPLDACPIHQTSPESNPRAGSRAEQDLSLISYPKSNQKIQLHLRNYPEQTISHVTTDEKLLNGICFGGNRRENSCSPIGHHLPVLPNPQRMQTCLSDCSVLLFDILRLKINS